MKPISYLQKKKKMEATDVSQSKLLGRVVPCINTATIYQRLDVDNGAKSLGLDNGDL